MNTIEAIMSRYSTRSFTDRPITDEDMHTLLCAAMSGPSCANKRDWAFLVTRDRELMDKIADRNGRPAQPLYKASACVIVCGDVERAFPKAPEYWVIDGAIAAQNLILAAHELGIGSVWLGCYPQMERVTAQAELFGLPETVVPHSVIALGYPDEEAIQAPKKEKFYESDRVHFDKW